MVVARIGQQALAAIAVVLVSVASALAAAASPQRIVSLNLCTDQLLLDLVPHERIAALSFLAGDPTMSMRVEDARGLALLRGAAEEVLALDPDLIFAGTYSTPATVSLLERLGRRVVKVPMASSFEEIRVAVRMMAAEAGETARGEALIAAFNQRLMQATAGVPNEVHQPTAVAMQVNSLASGAGSLLDEVLAKSGFRNMARDALAQGHLGPAGRLPLETLLLNPPDLIVLANAADDYRTVLGDNLRHPAFEQMLKSRDSVHIPMHTWLCGTPAIAGAVEQLVRLRRSIPSRDRNTP